MQNSKFNRNIPFTLGHIALHAPTEVIRQICEAVYKTKPQTMSGYT